MKKLGTATLAIAAALSAAGTPTMLGVADASATSISSLRYPVTRVIDGDTIEVNANGTREKVRIVGVDTPEISAKAATKRGCFAAQAKSYMTARLTGKTVTIIRDTTQANRDKYGRLLRYVYLGVEDVGLTLVRNGYAREYSYGAGYLNKRVYTSAQATAKMLKRGLWSPKVCPVNT